ncbi:MAG TPA: hypothetical protein VMU88_08215, partial [bacterium]|nr:hypothetical protein [bacterium]
EPDALNPVLNGGVTACAEIGMAGIYRQSYNCVDTMDTKANLNAAVNNPSNWSGVSSPVVPACSLTVQ